MAFPPYAANDGFATHVYDNVLGRVANTADDNVWGGILNDGPVTSGQFVLEILRGAGAQPPSAASQDVVKQQVVDDGS